jgi:hypothetical protein
MRIRITTPEGVGDAKQGDIIEVDPSYGIVLLRKQQGVEELAAPVKAIVFEDIQKIETAEAAPAPETTAKRTTKPKPRTRKPK